MARHAGPDLRPQADDTLGQEQLRVTILILKMSVFLVKVLVSIPGETSAVFFSVG